MQLANPETGKIMCEGLLIDVLAYLRRTFPQDAAMLPGTVPHRFEGINATRRFLETYAAAKGYDLYS